MHKSKTLIRDLLILLFGLIGIIWFYYSFPTHHPMTMVNMQLEEDMAIQKADSIYQSWQFQSLEFNSRVNIRDNSAFVDSLQRKWGTKGYKEKIQESAYLNKLPLLSWEIRQTSLKEDEKELEYTVQMNTSGEVIGFTVSNEVVATQHPFNRYAVRTIYQDQVKGYSRGLEDSLITGLVDYQHLSNNSRLNSQALAIMDRIRKIRGGADEDLYTIKNYGSLADFYLKRTAWNAFNMKRDSVILKDEDGFRFGRAFMSANDPESGVRANITMDLLPAGSLLNLEYELEPKVEEDEEPYLDVILSSSLLIVLAFAIWLLFVFYLRIKARAVDTRPAIIIAVLAGFMVPGFWILQFIRDMGLMNGLPETNVIINSLMGFAVLGAVSAVGFFVLTAVSDSVTRQYWPEKLRTWDFIRRGMIMNKPIGWGIINALAIGGVMAGFVALYLTLVPNTYISGETEFISNDYFLPSIANLMVTTCYVLLLAVPIYLILGNQIRGVTGKDWIIPIISAFLFALMDVLPFNIEPDGLDRIMRSLLGLILGLFYLRYDFLTIAFGFLLFVNILTTSKGWIVESSPDANTFFLFVTVAVSFFGFAMYCILKGTNRDELPEYVPDYIEDQAKEQRLKQELSIARLVQETFLPSKIHRLPGIDVAGICIPAQETGGDYYDMIPLGEQRTAIAIGDVSGKGIRASFYMTFTKGVLHSLSALILSPVDLLNQLNRLFNENATRGTFISMIYGILEADKRQFTFARAGHNPMLVVRQNGDTEWLQPDGLGIGVSKGDEFMKRTREATLKLDEGDVIILYTDGITEMLNTGNHFYGEDRLERLVKGVREASSEQILKIITDDVNDFKGMAKQHDDMTLVIIKADSSIKS